MQYKAVVFDLDGTLVNSLEDLADSVNMVLSSRGFPQHELDSYRYLVGDGSRNLIRRALPREQDEATVSSCLQEFKEEYAKRWADKSRPYPGIPELLGELEALGVPAAVVTNKMEDFANRVVARFFPGVRLDPIIGHREDLPLKPDPAGALEAAQRLEVSPSECIYLGDSGVDMQTARSAGMHPVGVLWGFRPERELRQNGAALLLTEPAELLPHLQDKRKTGTAT